MTSSTAFVLPAGSPPAGRPGAATRSPRRPAVQRSRKAAKCQASPAQAADKGVSFGSLDGSSCRIGVVSSRWNSQLVDPLTADVRAALKELGVKDENVVEMSVPGSWELPVAARYMTQAQKVDSVVAIGVLIQGETSHYEYISDAVTSGLMSLQVQTGIPVVLGVLTCLNEDQARDRSTGSKSHSLDWGRTAVEMALLRASQLGGPNFQRKSVGFS